MPGERLMAAEVSSLTRMMRDYEEEGKGTKRELVTIDFLGGGHQALLGSPEVDLELQYAVGCERDLDLLSRRTYLRRRDHNPKPHHALDLTLTPPPLSPAALFLAMGAAAPPSAAMPTVYGQSVCTLEKVKSALERAEREDRSPAAARRPVVGSASSPASSITTSSSSKRPAADEDGPGTDSPRALKRAAITAAGCSACHLYVLVTAADPKCPRCEAHVPLNGEPVKRPEFDLNSAVGDDDDLN
ncbi:hypothetical protein Cni_G26597 [Canna indica]|uniref:GIR1-like zinc ribbon domain-containing protein n=1 Tax=Canna indica TaxID=4628 RepID=A0AAQ3QNJ0_9LILI|nr:hypothetical protein Cni_G26597 [Canna indica]